MQPHDRRGGGWRQRSDDRPRTVRASFTSVSLCHIMLAVRDLPAEELIVMTQTQLVAKLAEDCEVSKKVSRQLLDSLATIAVREVKAKGLFVLPGLGRFVRVDRKARIGPNPATGTQLNISAET